jgi:Membrane bound O-acyl transferase family
MTSLMGLTQIPMMLNPLFESTSVSDFWGRRWNLVVHGFLKRGVYKPVRTKYSKMAAATATFLASGFFHEWLLSIMSYPQDDSGGYCTPPSCVRPGYGRNTLFFVYNALLIGLEYAIGGAIIFQLLKKHLPTTMLSLLIASTALPVAHWFTNDYLRLDFFHDGQLAWPIIIRLNE